MKVRLFNIIIILIAFTSNVYSTHNRAGEITVRQMSGLTYEITVKTFTYSLSLADRPRLPIDWGDNSPITELVRNPEERALTTVLEGNMQVNIYKGIHTYTGPGIYTIVVEDPNRNYGIKNIPNSVNIVFSISTKILISSELEYNSTPILLSNPIDRAAKGHIFIHNPAAYDIDGDSISYELTKCTGENGEEIKQYSFPKSSFKPVYIDPVNGNLVWDSPIETGAYNIAINVEEWRYGVKIGNILRDMQINVYETDNSPPINDTLFNYCIIAGDSIYFEITSHDNDLDRMTHEFIGGPFEIQYPPIIRRIPESDTNGTLTSSFFWKARCEHVKRLPYNIILKTKDINSDVSLVDIDNFFIKVIGPTPENVNAEASNTSINLSWDSQTCEKIKGYNIYRKIGKGSMVQDSCETGIEGLDGFKLIDYVAGRNSNTYTDDENGTGLAQGIEFCYVIAARYNDEALSKPSEETCAILLPGSPPMMNVSITNIDESTGSAYISWIKPKHLDTIPGPYETIIQKSDDIKGDNFIILYSFLSDSLNDTTYIDSGFNTVNYPYSYKVELYNTSPRFLIGNPETASSLFSDIEPDDNQLRLNFKKNTPWLNNEYIVFRKNKNTGIFDSIGNTAEDYYIDDQLANGTEYCYKVKSKGWRMIDSLIYNNENWSHVNCGIPIDKTPPCAPEVSILSNCNNNINTLKWYDLNQYCANDVIKYRIYYKRTLDDPFKIIDSLSNNEIIITNDSINFNHIPQQSLAGCYMVTAIDSFNNVSTQSNIACTNGCSGYLLPNIYTPYNPLKEIYKSVHKGGVEKVNMQIFNRWGMLVYETTDPDINWDGKYNGKMVSSGVYFYICEVFEEKVTGSSITPLTGFIHVYTERPKGFSTFK